MSFRDNLREALDFASMEQKELAAKTGISLKTIENYVKKDSSLPSADKAVLIAQALGVTVEFLITGEKTNKTGIPNMLSQNKEVFATISKLNKYNSEIIIAIAKTLLDLQKKSSAYTS